MASMMRRLAWCGISQSTSRLDQPVRRQRLVDPGGELGDRVAEHLLAGHAQLAALAVRAGAAID